MQYQSRRSSRVYDIINNTINKENQQPQSNLIKKIDNKIGSLNKIYQQAVQDQQTLNEQQNMLIEDLNGKLLQRAEHIAQYEELDELIDQYKIKNPFEFDFSQNARKKNHELMQKNLRNKVNQESEIAYQSYIKNQQNYFNQVQQEYGDEVVQQIKKECKQQIHQILAQQYAKTIQSIVKVMNDFNKIHNLIQQNVRYVDENLSSDLYKINQTMKVKKDQVKSIQQKLDSQSKDIYNMQMIYNEILDNDKYEKQNSSNKKSRSYSEINQKKQALSAEKKDRRLQTDKLNESLHFSQFVDSCIDSSKSSACQLSADDSLLQHFNDLNMSIIQVEKKKYLNMPLQKQDKTLEQLQKDILRLQTITEEQLSTKRDISRLKDRPEDLKMCKQQLKFSSTQNNNRTISTTSYSQVDHNQTKSIIPQFFNQQNNPQTMKNQKPLLFQFSSSNPNSELVIKHTKSKSFDYTSNKDIQQKRLFMNQETKNDKQEHLLPLENEILKLVRPLTQGLLIHKKFSSKPTLTRQEFNPLQQSNPQVCGYGQRLIQLSINLDKIEFKNQMKLNVQLFNNQSVDSFIPLDQIMRTSISKQILNLIQIKRRIKDKLILSSEEKQILQITHWPLTIVTQQDGKTELLFENEDQLEQWNSGLQFLKDNIKTLQIICRKLRK